MIQRYLYILQSGFVTPATVELIKTEEPTRTLRDNLYVQDARVVDTDNYYDEGIDDLFNMVRKDENLISQFEVRERILMAFYRVFQGESIKDWISLQFGQRTVGYLHYKFLMEMLARAVSNTAKTLDNNQYFRLLSASEATRQQPGADKAAADLRTRMNDFSTIATPDVLRYWTSDTHGLMDLLHSMQIIFGRRTGVQTVARRR